MKTVKLINTTGNVRDTKIVDVETGAEIHGVMRADVEVSPSQSVLQMRIEIGFVQTHAQGRAVFLASHPVTGELAEISRIVFADGSTFEA